MESAFNTRHYINQHFMYYQVTLRNKWTGIVLIAKKTLYLPSSRTDNPSIIVSVKAIISTLKFNKLYPGFWVSNTFE